MSDLSFSPKRESEISKIPRTHDEMRIHEFFFVQPSIHCVTSRSSSERNKNRKWHFVNQHHLRLLIKRRKNAKWNFCRILFFCVNVNDRNFCCTCASMNYRFRSCCRKINKLKIAFECRDETIAASEHIYFCGRKMWNS